MILIYELSREYVMEEISKIGVDIGSIPIFERKREIIPIKVCSLRTPAAIIIKQEMLAAGGDAAIERGAITCSKERGDVVLLGTLKTYLKLIDKLRSMNYFQLPELADEIENLISRKLNPSEVVVIRSPWGRVLKLDGKVKLMGVMNLTPDSFYSGSRVKTIDELLARVESMLNEGADIIDLGAVSTRPGAKLPPPDEERRRLLQPLKAVREAFPDAFISVDSFRTEILRDAIELGADMVNDVSGFQFDPELPDLIVKLNVPVVINHIKGKPENMQDNPVYDDLISELISYFKQRLDLLYSKGYDNVAILDPGIGFGKRLQDNLQILARITEFKSLGKPVMIGASRKSFIGTILDGIPPEERLEGTIAVSAICAMKGVDILRVHDVKPNRMAVRVAQAIANVQRRGDI